MKDVQHEEIGERRITGKRLQNNHLNDKKVVFFYTIPPFSSQAHFIRIT